MLKLEKEKKEQIKKYIKLQHRKSHKWLQEHIHAKFGETINLNTIRTWKRGMGCLTNKKDIKKDWVNYIRVNYLNYSDKELAERLYNKFQRPISSQTVKAIRHKKKMYRPVKLGYTVKEIRLCKNCGKEINITCRNPNQTFCCRDCCAKYSSKETYKKYREVATNEKIKEFYLKWLHFSKKVLSDKKRSLTALDLDDVYSEYMAIIPSLIYGIEKNNYTKRERQKTYIAVAIDNLIKKKLRKRIEIEKFEYNIDEYRHL